MDNLRNCLDSDVASGGMLGLIKKFIRVVIPLFVITGTPLLSNAADYKAYPGSICQAYSGGHESGIKRHASRGIGNYSDEYRWIVCPIIKDAVDEFGFRLETWVYVRTGAPIECYLLASDPYGNTIDQDHGYAHGDATKIYLQTDQGHVYGSWGLNCRLEPNALLHSYLVLEHADE